MRSRQKGLISLAVMIILTLALVYTSKDIYDALSSFGGNGMEALTENSTEESKEAESGDAGAAE